MFFVFPFCSGCLVICMSRIRVHSRATSNRCFHNFKPQSRLCAKRETVSTESPVIVIPNTRPLQREMCDGMQSCHFYRSMVHIPCVHWHQASSIPDSSSRLIYDVSQVSPVRRKPNPCRLFVVPAPRLRPRTDNGPHHTSELPHLLQVCRQSAGNVRRAPLPSSRAPGTGGRLPTRRATPGPE